MPFPEQTLVCTLCQTPCDHNDVYCGICGQPMTVTALSSLSASSIQDSQVHHRQYPPITDSHQQIRAHLLTPAPSGVTPHPLPALTTQLGPTTPLYARSTRYIIAIGVLIVAFLIIGTMISG